MYPKKFVKWELIGYIPGKALLDSVYSPMRVYCFRSESLEDVIDGLNDYENIV